MACTIDFRCLDEGFGGKTYKRKRETDTLIHEKPQNDSSMEVETELNNPPSKRAAIASSEDPNRPIFGKATYNGVISGRVSGRNWKQPRKRRSSSMGVSRKPPSLEQRMRERELKKAYKERKEMASPEVDKRLLEELQEMGFSLGCATRALHYSGNTSLEDAIDWIVNHENDSDIDQIPLIPVDIVLDAPKPFPISEGVKISAQRLSLRKESKQSGKEKESELEREREKERIQAWKRILEAKQIAEENARKRMIMLREADKEEERKARKIIRQKFEADKAERRAKLGMPSAPSLKPACHVDNMVQEQSAEVSKPVKSTKKAELLSDCLRGLRRYHKDEDARVKKAFQTLQIYIRNVMNNPDVEKYRNIRFSNPVFQEIVGSLTGGIRFLELCGFERTNQAQFFQLPREKVDMETLTSAMSALQSAITNPFFGLLSAEQP